MTAQAAAIPVLLLALVITETAQAQAAPGNTRNPSGDDPLRLVDERGLSHLRTVRRRSPAGSLYPAPPEPDRLRTLGEGWLYRGELSLGALWTAGDDREARFLDYADWRDGPLIDSIAATLAHVESGFVADARAGSIGRNDVYFHADVGVPGLVRVRGSLSGVPRVAATDARSVYGGLGGATLQLSAPLVPGANADSEIAALLGGTPERTLAWTRDRTQVSVDFVPMEPLTLFARYGYDETSGERPYGGALMFDSGGEPARVVETVEPRYHRTHRFGAGMRVRSARLHANLEYDGSVFRNRDSVLVWDNPFDLGASAGGRRIERGRFALAPDNAMHGARGTASVRLPWRAVLTATTSWSRMRQDAGLVAPTVNSGIVGAAGVNAVDLDRWNSNAALSRQSADAEVDTILAVARLSLRPIDPLRIGARFRYHGQRNATRYTARNPVTGELGYVAEDGAHAVLTPFERVFDPDTGTSSPLGSDDFRYRSSPYDHRKRSYRIDLDYSVLDRTTLGARYGREEIERDERERDETWEDRVRLSVTSRDVSRMTLRASYEYRDRRGGPYNSFPNRDDYVSSLDGFVPFLSEDTRPFTLAQLRKFDVADRVRHEARWSTDLLLRDDIDLSLTLRFVDDDYGADYGLEHDRRGQIDLDLGFAPSPRVQAHLFGHFGKGRTRTSGINSAEVFPMVDDPDAGGVVFPLENAWRIEGDETTWGAGAGFRLQPLARIVLDADYAFVDSRSAYAFQAAGPGALAPGVMRAASLPDLRTIDHALRLGVRIALVERAGVLLRYRLEHSRIVDFSQRGLVPETVLTSSGALFLGHRDLDYTAHVFAITVQVRF